MIVNVIITLAMILGILIHGGQINQDDHNGDNFGNAVLMALEVMVIALVWA